MRSSSQRVAYIFETIGKDLTFNSNTFYSVLAIGGYTMVIIHIAIVQTIEAVFIGLLIIITPFVLLMSFNNAELLKTFNKDLFGMLKAQIITPILLNLFIPMIINFKDKIVGINELLLLIITIILCYKCPSLLKITLKNKEKQKDVIKDLNLEKDDSDLFTIL